MSATQQYESVGEAIVRRFGAGESPVDLAPDYRTTVASILAVLTWAAHGYRGDPPALAPCPQGGLDT